MSNNEHKSWLSPFVAVTYLAVSITGILMLFHLKFPGMYPIHKWGGLIFIVGGIVHLTLNWRIFVTYFKKSRAIWALSIGTMVLIFIAIAVPSDSHNRGYKNRYHSSIETEIVSENTTVATLGVNRLGKTSLEISSTD